MKTATGKLYSVRKIIKNTKKDTRDGKGRDFDLRFSCFFKLNYFLS